MTSWPTEAAATACAGATFDTRSAAVPLAINGRYLTRRTTGVERVARGIVDVLDARVDDDGLLHAAGIAFRPCILAPKGEVSLPPGRIPVDRTARLSGNAWEQCELPWSARGALLLNLCNTAPVLARAQCTYVHDAGVYAIAESYDWRFRAWYRCLHRFYRLRGDRLLTNSVFSARELRRHAGFSLDRLHVAPPGCDHVHGFADTPMPEAVARLAAGRGYYVIVGSRARHKNIAVAVEAHRRHLRTHPQSPALVMIGGERRDIFGHDHGADDRADDGVLHLGYLDDPTLVAILRRARALIFPSRYEGFGLPLVEAMALGCPVVASDLPTAREIGIGACWVFPPGDADALAAQLALVDAHPHQVSQKVLVGRQRAAGLSWDACADAVLDTLAQGARQRRERTA
jgi:glycosyltransferase involved in cell wall biosynthesis